MRHSFNFYISGRDPSGYYWGCYLNYPESAPPCAQRSVRLKGDNRNDTYAAGERLRTLGYLRLAEKTGMKL